MRILLLNKNLYILCFFLLTIFGYAQQGGVGENYTCETAVPVCPDDNFGVDIPNVLDVPDAQDGPDYGCLISQPRPMWFYMRVATSGNAIFDLNQYTEPGGQGTGLDVDFILWGPFESQDACNDLTQENIVDCSYSGQPVEIIDFDSSTVGPGDTPNPSPVNEGEYYILLVTNYDNTGRTGFVNLLPRDEMTATFDCSILGPTYNFCDIGGDGQEEVNLSNYEEEISEGNPDVIVSFHGSSQDAYQSQNPVSTIQTLDANSLTIYARKEDVVTTQVEVVVITFNLIPVPELQEQTLSFCDNNGDGVEVFDLTLADVVVSAEEEVTLSYHTNQDDADAGENAIEDPTYYSATNGTVVYVRADTGDCYITTTITLYVISGIELANDSDFKCDTDLDGQETFNLNDYINNILNGNTGDIRFYENESDAIAGNDNFITNTDNYTTGTITLYAYVGSGGCNATATLTLNVFESPELNEVTEPYEFCDDDNNGVEVVDLSSVLADLGATSSNYTITYHTSQADAQNGENPIDNPTSYELTSNTNIYVNVSAGDCSSVGMVSFVLHLRPDTNIAESYAICSGYSVNVDAGAGFTSYTWSTGETTQVIEISNLGNYWVDLTFGNGCTFRKEFTVISGEAPIIANVEAGQNSFTITAEEGTPPYQYSNGGFIYQDSNVISNLNAGTYYLYVRDAEGCISNVELGVLFEWATLFTPNGDGINDYFVIPNIDVYQGSGIKIYDRAGALVYKANITTNEVWDGKDMSGNKVPSQDYWYIIDLTDGRKFTGYITVKNRTEKGF